MTLIGVHMYRHQHQQKQHLHHHHHHHYQHNHKHIKQIQHQHIEERLRKARFTRCLLYKFRLQQINHALFIS